MRNLIWVAVALAVGAAGYLLGRFASPTERADTAREPVTAPVSEAHAPEEHETGPVMDCRTWVPGDELDAGTILRFPAGKHRWQVSALKDVPEDLWVEGVGMDQTLLRIDEIRSHGEILNLTFRDMTIDCANHSFTDLHEHASIRLERSGPGLQGTE